MTTKPLTKDDPEAVELLDLDVRFVSGVGEPATGKRWLLLKSKDGLPTETNGVNMNEDNRETILRELGLKISRALGIQTADETLVEATDALKAIAEKASGKAPKDDAGSGEPSYAGMNKPKNNLPGQAPDTSSTKAPKVAEKAAPEYEGEATWQAELTDGQPVTGLETRQILMGKPVTKSVALDVLSSLEGNVTNPEALREAREALFAAFEEPQEEPHMTDGEVRSLLLKALEPIVDAVEEIQDVLAKAIEEAEAEEEVAQDPRFDELAEQVEALQSRLNAVVERTSAEPTERRVTKSRVPVVQPVAKDALWGGSPFDVAAGIE